jgi:hypothetical protein
MEDDEIRTTVQRLSRSHPSGGRVIERAAILAAGTGAQEVIAWILEHEGVGEVSGAAAQNRGLHGTRLQDGREPGSAPTPQRFVLPPGALG